MNDCSKLTRSSLQCNGSVGAYGFIPIGSIIIYSHSMSIKLTLLVDRKWIVVMVTVSVWYRLWTSNEVLKQLGNINGLNVKH